MNIFKLTFEEEVRHEHEIIVKTDLSWDELSDVIDEINFDDCNLQENVVLKS